MPIILAPKTMASKVTLEVTAGPIAGRRFEFTSHETFLFGRSPDCHADLPSGDTSASRHHFQLEVNPPAVRLRDLGSLNGTHVNGVRHGGRAGYCVKHYRRWQRHGDPTVTLRRDVYQRARDELATMTTRDDDDAM